MQGFWVLLLTLCAIACYAMSLAPVTWVLITEIFPNRVRASAVSVSIAALWVSSFAVTYTFPILNNRLGSGGTFLVYGAICLLGAVFVFFAVPETQGTSLDDIDLRTEKASG
jgi:SP family xylose:H+ symportor-like MFS transporter